jgi:hypothetical protein
VLFARVLLGLACLLSASVAAADGWSALVDRPAGSFDRAAFHDEGSLTDVRTRGDLKGSRCCVAGWADYDVHVEATGWYQLWVRGSAQETLIDPDSGGGAPRAYFTGGSGIARNPDKIGNVWLEAGVHTVRFQSDAWYGFSGLTAFYLRRSADDVAGTVSIRWPGAARSFRAGGCPAFDLLYGGRAQVATVLIETRRLPGAELVSRERLVLPAATGLATIPFHVPCTADGFFRVSLAEERDGRPRDLEAGAVKGFDYEVVDVAHPPASAPPRAPFRLAIDCAARVPDYAAGGTELRSARTGTYRESGEVGWVPYQRLGAVARAAATEPSWFAYRLPGLEPGRRYRLDVTYPDDADRAFGIFLREAAALHYTLGVGVDTGGPYVLSDGTRHATLGFFARDAEPRLVLAPAHDGSRAACARIEVAAVEPGEPVRPAAATAGTRQFVHWYEEGINFIDLFGAADASDAAIARAADRWAGTVAEAGGTTLMPTVLVYGMQLYPSTFNRIDSQPERDVLRRLVLAAERFHLRIIPELHPRADELGFGLTDAELRRLLLVAKDGHDDLFAGDGRTRNRPPHYNALLPQTQRWLVGMVGELAERYRDSPALDGISLRVARWSNAALDNLVDLDWGYDDATVARFAADTGLGAPALTDGDAGRFQRRYAWLTGPGRAAWVGWRCRQVTALVARLAARVRAVRPDLRLYLHVFPADEYRAFAAGDMPSDRLRAAGLDPAALAAIPGVALVDSSASYGRREPGAVASGLLDGVRRPEVIRDLVPAGGAGRYVAPHRYFEATDAIVPAARLGFPAATPTPWASLAAPPAGVEALERFAAELAIGDALMLGDGGNGALPGVPGLAGFLAAYTRLPARPFTTRSAPGTPVTVRSLADPAGEWVYAVNTRAAPAWVQLTLRGGATLRSVGSEPLVRLAAPEQALRVGPFGLVAVRLGPGVALEAVRTGLGGIEHAPAAACCAGAKPRRR